MYFLLGVLIIWACGVIVSSFVFAEEWELVHGHLPRDWDDRGLLVIATLLWPFVALIRGWLHLYRRYRAWRVGSSPDVH